MDELRFYVLDGLMMLVDAALIVGSGFSLDNGGGFLPMSRTAGSSIGTITIGLAGFYAGFILVRRKLDGRRTS